MTTPPIKITLICFLFVLVIMVSFWKCYVPNHETFVSDVDTDLKPFLFVHVPKTGGNAIKTSELFENSHYFSHSKITNIRNRIHHKVISYSVVRNPYDRLVSAYFYLKNGGRSYYDKSMMKKLEPYKTFKQFVHNLDKFITEIHIKPQFLFVTDHDGETILVDHILKQETLNSDFTELQKKFGFRVRDLDVVNHSNHNKDFEKYYDAETKRIVYQTYKRDFELFNYTP